MPSRIQALFLTFFILLFCNISGYTQVVVSSDGESTPITVDYSMPQKYEVGGITLAGSANFDQRLLYFSVGDIIEIPGELISKSIKRLWNTGLYEDIDISITRVVGDVVFLEVYLVERSRLVAFAFKGTTKNEENDIRGKIKITQGNIVNDNMKITSGNTIKNYFLDKGFYNCTVSVKEEKDKKVVNGVNLVFDINKGKKVKIESINFEGNANVSKAVLTKSMRETKEKSRFMPFYKADTVVKYMFQHPDYYRSKDLFEHLNDYFSERIKFRIFKPSKFIKENYESDKNLLVEKYNELGYRDAHILSDTVAINGNKMEINIKVNEGNRYYFRNIDFIGNTKYPTELLRQILRIQKGDIYNQALLNQNLTMNESGTDLSSLYMNDGYLFFYAHPVEVQVENDSIDIEIRIREGKQATYNKITVSGNTKTNDNVILREVTTMPGQLFNRADIIRTQQVLLSLGYFNQEKMNVIPKPNEADGTVDVEYVVEETSSDQFELSAGYGAGGLLLSAGISFNNFSARQFFKKDAWTPIPSGDGQRLALRVSTNATYYQYYSISFTEPWLGGNKPISMTIGANYAKNTNGQKKASSTFGAIDIVTASVSFAKKLKWPDDYFQMSHTILYQHYRVNNWNNVFVFNNGYSNSFSYIFSIGRNSVSAPIYPREGSDIMFSVQLTPPYSAFSNKDYSSMSTTDKYKWLEFHKWKFNISWYTKVVENLVLNVRMKTGFIGAYNKDIGPTPFERFYLGGDGLSSYSYDGREVIGMRGYADAALTPTVDGNEVGGIIYNKFTAELRYPITLNPSATIYILAFAEAGNSWLDKRSYSPFKLYKSAGLGVRIFLPMFGLLGFDWGYGFDEVPGQSGANGSRFHISINSSID